MSKKTRVPILASAVRPTTLCGITLPKAAVHAISADLDERLKKCMEARGLETLEELLGVYVAQDEKGFGNS